MLDTQVFQEGIEEIQNTYISKRFTVVDNQNQWRQWYKILKPLSNNAFSEAVSEWCMTKSTLPSPSDIIELANKHRNVDNSVEIPKNKDNCNICRNTGLIKGYFKHQLLKKEYEYVACCICEAGEYCHSIYALPQIKKEKLNYLQKLEGNNKEKNIQEEIKRVTQQMTMQFE